MSEDKIKKIKMILMDVDGVLTDGGIILGNEGLEIKIFNVQDGMGITLARKAGLKIGIITGRNSEAVSSRAQELEIDELSQGHFDKLSSYMSIKEKFGFTDEEIAYIGDDMVDLPILNRVGFSVAVANAREEIKPCVDYVTTASGGKGAVREVIDLILKTLGKWDEAIEKVGLMKGDLKAE